MPTRSFRLAPDKPTRETRSVTLESADLPELSLQPVSASVNGASSMPMWLRVVA